MTPNGIGFSFLFFQSVWQMVMIGPKPSRSWEQAICLVRCNMLYARCQHTKRVLHMMQPPSVVTELWHHNCACIRVMSVCLQHCLVSGDLSWLGTYQKSLASLQSTAAGNSDMLKHT